MALADEMAALTRQLESFSTGLRADHRGATGTFFAPDADFRGEGDFVRSAGAISADASDAVRARESGDVISMRWLTGTIALVDGTFDTDEGKGWFTEIWDKNGDPNRRGDYVVRTERIRVGPPVTSFQSLNRMNRGTVGDNVSAAVRRDEEAALRARFTEFRNNFNQGNAEAVAGMFTTKADAMPTFSFLEGRAQILNGQTALAAKAERMNPGALVSNPAMRQGAGAAFVGGEPKVIRFLSPTLAVVDGTAEINNIPRAHGFAPREMRGVYTDVWRKVRGRWMIEGTRPWF
jgi:ketosteroid isomerase-like protein